ncbi:uncharacterized protein VTP21DRAFT_888 [Calcarisporiella thermophila]|uniref:uncharacterized protein n=1 Tax=Calcarisporiella thermophila TaxID=911321 RepID=UPI003744A418
MSTLADPHSVLDNRTKKLREDWIKSMEIRIVRDQLSKCYKTEGVNHYQNCQHLAQLYMQVLRENRFEGFRVKKQDAEE